MTGSSGKQQFQTVLISLVPFEGNYTFRIVQSGSMEPTIPTGSVIATIPRTMYEVGDIVTFNGTALNPMPTTHRIVGEEGEEEERVYITKGDANEDEDYRRISNMEIQGKVFLIVPYVGYMSAFFATPNGKAILITFVILSLVLMFVPWRTILIDKKKEKNGNV